MKILVIEALGLHLGYLGCYGNDWVATPNLDRIAAEGIVFDTHIVDQPELRAGAAWSERSVATGRYALPREKACAPPVLQPRVTRVEALRTFASEALKILQGGDCWIEGPSLLPPWRLDDELLDAYFDEDDVEEGLAPWPDPPLGPVKLNEAEVLQLQNTYAAAVTVFDAQIGVLLERLPLGDTLLCVTARSGLPIGEHGMIGAPRPLLHAELVHVPLLLRLPNGADAGLRIAALTQPIDLSPTFLESLGQPTSPTHGRSLWPLVRGEIDAIRPFAFSALRVGAEESWLMRTLDAALHLPVEHSGDASPRLFVKPEDRWEVNDLYQQQIERADEMEKTLRTFVEEIGRPIASSER